MNRFTLACRVFPLLLISLPSVAEPPHETAFEPAPVFEDEDLYAKAKRWEPRTTAKAGEQTAPPVATPLQAPAPHPNVSQTAAASSAPADSSGQAKWENPAAEQNPLKENLPVALIALVAVGGLFIWQKPSTKMAPPSAQTRRAHGEPTGTGVEGYLKPVVGVAAFGETGVSRYMKSVVGAATGGSETAVARYLKNVASTTPVAGPETGVARYLKNRT